MTIEDHPANKTPNAPATPEPAEPAGQPGAGASQGRQAGAAAFSVEAITYAEEQWDQIRTVFRDELGIDADQTWCPITPVMHKSLRSYIELAVSQYYFQSAATSRRRRRAGLSTLRKDIKNMRARIIDAFAVEVDPKFVVKHLMLLPGVDADMLPSTNDYIRKVVSNLDRQIEQAGQRGDNARKTARDHCWNELLTIWCDIGGKATGKAAANFLIVTSKPVMGSAVPDITSVMRWLERRQNKTAKKVTKPVPRRPTR